MSTLAVIPARYASVRLPGKALADLHGKPLVVHAMERAREARRVDDVLVATDDQRIVDAVQAHGGEAVMTSPDCATGSDRIAEVVAARPEVKRVVNLQGDEPMMPPAVIDRVVEALEHSPSADLATARVRILDPVEYRDPNAVKVVCDAAGRAFYFSRSPLPNLSRDCDCNDDAALASTLAQRPVFKHFGLYAYRREALLDFVRWPRGPLEETERLEQLRFLEQGRLVLVVTAEQDSIGVDTPEDLERVRGLMAAR